MQKHVFCIVLWAFTKKKHKSPSELTILAVVSISLRMLLGICVFIYGVMKHLCAVLAMWNPHKMVSVEQSSNLLMALGRVIFLTWSSPSIPIAIVCYCFQTPKDHIVCMLDPVWLLKQHSDHLSYVPTRPFHLQRSIVLHVLPSKNARVRAVWP